MADDPFAQYAVKDDPFAAYAVQATAPPQDRGILQGLKNTLPSWEGLKALPAAVEQGIKDSLANTSLKFDPAKDTTSPIGKMRHGQPGEGFGELVGGLGQLAATEGVGGYLRGKLTTPPPEMINGINVADLKAAGVGDQALDVMRNGRPKPTTGVLRTTAQPASEQPRTFGSSALQPEYQPVTAPVATPPSMTPTEGGITPTRQMELLQKFGGTAEAPKSVPLGQPRIMSVKETPTSWTPEAARARIEFNDWHSGAEPGSPEAKTAQAMHRYDGETESRYKYLLDSPNGSIRPELLTKLGMLPVKYGAAAWTAREMGVPGWAGAAALGASDLVRAYPEGSLEALRAALVAQMTSHGNSPTSTGR